MHHTGLDFAPGTTDESKRLVGSLFTPSQIFSAYQAARKKFNTGDLVLTVSEQDPSGFKAEPRVDYIRGAKAALGGRRLPLFMRALADKSAQAIMQLPFESDAMWLIVVRGPQAVPVMCVIYATSYEVSKAGDSGEESAILAN